MSGSLDHPPSDIIRQMIADLSVGTTSQSADWSIFNSDKPDEPDKILTIYDTTPILQGITQVNGEVQGFYGIQIEIRGTTFSNAWTKAKTAYTNLDPILNQLVTVDSTDYIVHNMNRVSGPIPVGKEVPQSKRDLITLNYTCSIRQNS